MNITTEYTKQPVESESPEIDGSRTITISLWGRVEDVEQKGDKAVFKVDVSTMPRKVLDADYCKHLRDRFGDPEADRIISRMADLLFIEEVRAGITVM